MSQGRIVWREGMFVAPQHFQVSDDRHEALVAEAARLDLSGDDHGLSRLRIDRTLLPIGKIGLTEAVGLFPDRTLFDLREALVRDVPDGAVDVEVLLAVPLAIAGAAQVGAVRGLHRWIARDLALADLTDADAPPLEAEVADLGLCLKLSTEDLSGFAAIPVARILEKTAEGRVVLDDSFLPVCIAIGASDRIMVRVDEVLSLARARANNAAARLRAAEGAQSTASLVIERLELDLLNRALQALQEAAAHPWMSPRRLHGLLAQLLAGLDAQAGRVADPDLRFVAADPTACFDRLIGRLKAALTLESRASVTGLRWNDDLFEKRRLLRLVVPQRLLAERRRPVLAVSATGHDGALGALVPRACKLAGISAMPDLVVHGLPGVGLLHLPVAPPELRDRADTAFFAVDTASPQWQRFQDRSEALALHVDERIGAPAVTLYLIGAA